MMIQAIKGDTVIQRFIPLKIPMGDVYHILTRPSPTTAYLEYVTPLSKSHADKFSEFLATCNNYKIEMTL